MNERPTLSNMLSVARIGRLRLTCGDVLYASSARRPASSGGSSHAATGTT